MASKKEKRNIKIDERCDALYNVITSISDIYHDSNTDQKSYIETMIGAALWYIPKPLDAWTNHISLKLLKAFHPKSKVENPRISEEHVYPRKLAARMLLTKDDLSPELLKESFYNKFSRLHYITPEENRTAQQFQRVNIFNNPEEVYVKAGITLILIDPKDLSDIKNRKAFVIEKYIETYIE